MPSGVGLRQPGNVPASEKLGGGKETMDKKELCQPETTAVMHRQILLPAPRQSVQGLTMTGHSPNPYITSIP